MARTLSTRTFIRRCAIRRFARAAHELGVDTTEIHPDDYGRIAEFDALFIRETTAVDHHSFRFARRATSEGLIVIDDPESIVRCCNKVFLAEAFARAGIPRPRTLGRTAHLEEVARCSAELHELLMT